MIKKKATMLILSAALTVSCLGMAVGCSSTAADNQSATASTISASSSENSSGNILGLTDIFTDRDLEQTADTTDAEFITVSNGEDIHITNEGVYVISGSASNTTIYVEADDSAKVQIVLDGTAITNESKPVIYVSEADKVFVTTSSDSSLTVTGDYSFAEDDAADGVIFSRSDLTLNGTASLTISSSDNGVVSKDTLKITGGIYSAEVSGKAFEANDEILIADGTFTIKATEDGFHVENSDDGTLGYLYICGGNFTINAGDQGLQASSVIQIDGGTFTISADEGIEATYVQINDGTLSIEATDDGINASQNSNSYSVVIEITGGVLDITMASGDTDALDANGDLIISGGILTISATSAFDYDGSGSLTGGTVTVNGEQVSQLTQQMMAGGMGQGNAPGGNDMNGSMNSPGGNTNGSSGNQSFKNSQPNNQMSRSNVGDLT